MIFQDFAVWKPSRNGCNRTSGALDSACLWRFRVIKNILTKIFYARPIYRYGFRWGKTAKSMKSVNLDQNQGKSLKIMIFRDFATGKPSRNGCNRTSGALDSACLWRFRVVKNILTKICFARPIYKYGFRWWKIAKSMKSINLDQNQENSAFRGFCLFSIILIY